MTGTSTLALAAALVAATPLAALADGPGGSLPRAWVSGLGVDNSTCGTIKAPCRTFQYAHDSIVAPGGTLYVKDPANYVATPPVVISHAISIINDGVGPATIVAAGADAIDINAGPNDAVLLKGLILDGSGTGTAGINLTSAGSLVVANCTVKGFRGSNGAGILIQPSTGNVSFDITDTLTTGNSNIGVGILPGFNAKGENANANVKGVLTRVDVSGNGVGVAASNYINAGSVTVVASQINANNNTYGITTNASVYLNGSTVSGNSYGLSGPFFSYGNNAINGNTNDIGNATVTKVGLQ